jgi:hypothetical protein
MSAKPRVIWRGTLFNNFYPMQRIRPARFEGKQWLILGEVIGKRVGPDPVRPHMGPRVGARVVAKPGHRRDAASIPRRRMSGRRDSSSLTACDSRFVAAANARPPTAMRNRA